MLAVKGSSTWDELVGLVPGCDISWWSFRWILQNKTGKSACWIDQILSFHGKTFVTEVEQTGSFVRFL